jgi:hypothetical protein
MTGHRFEGLQVTAADRTQNRVVAEPAALGDLTRREDISILVAHHNGGVRVGALESLADAIPLGILALLALSCARWLTTSC